MRSLSVAALVLVGGCAAEDVEPLPLERFSLRPVMVQAALAECDDPHCAESLDDAVLFWVDHGVSMTIDNVDLGATSQLGLAVTGVIAVKCGKLSTWPKRVHGETHPYHSVLGDLLAAEVVLASCEAHVVAHELGHALMGPQHRDTRDNLMHAELAEAGWSLDADQIEAAADPW